jgi:hypothetical protein
MPFAKPIPDDGRVVATLQEMAKRWAPRSILDVELLTVREVAGLLRMSTDRAYKFIHSLPEGSIVRACYGSGAVPNLRILVHAWALARILNLEKCPGCGRNWPQVGESK